MGAPPDDDAEVTKTDGDSFVEVVDAIEFVDTPAPAPAPPPPPGSPGAARASPSTPPPSTAVAAGEPAPRTRSRSLPPPIPTDRRAAPQLLITGAPESPTVLDLAVAAHGATDGHALVRKLEEALAAAPEARNGACLAYELGDQLERLGDEARAVAAYRRAVELDADLGPARWALRRALYRRGEWAELAALIDREIDGDADSHERVDLLLEQARLPGRGDGRARALDIASRLAPRHRGLLLELERVRARDPARLLDVLVQLADAFEHVEHKIAYLVDAARVAPAPDHERARAALDVAARFAAALPAGRARGARVRIAREWLRLAEAHRTPDIGDAVEAVVQAVAVTPEKETPFLAVARRYEVVALRRHQAHQLRQSDPARAWQCLTQARAIAPTEPVVLGDLIELACELGHDGELPKLVEAWHGAESTAGRASMLAWWSSIGFSGSRRALREALANHVRAYLPLTAAAECDALADLTHVRGVLELANTYVIAAHAAQHGTWVGPGMAALPDAGAAAALYVQAAELLAYYVGTPTCRDQALEALTYARELAPDDPAVREAWIELDDETGTGELALAQLAAESPEPHVFRRAIRIAYGHERYDVVLEYERKLLALDPVTCAPAWRLDAMLAQLARNPERAEVLHELVQRERDPARRATALLGAARLAERAGDRDAACSMYRELVKLWPDDPFPRDALIEALRTAERWEELVTECLQQAKAATGPRAQARALREAAWVLEVRIGDPQRAADAYAEWLKRAPEERAALEGSARCCRARDDRRGEARARAAIAALERAPETIWAHACAVERAGLVADAAALYASVDGGDPPSVAGASAAIALFALAGTDVAKRAAAGEALANRSTDPRLAATLHEACGWMYLVALDDAERAERAFVAALDREADRRGAWLGAALAAACRGDMARLGTASAELARSLAVPELASPLLLRAAVSAQAAGDHELAYERVLAAREACPESVDALLVIAELDPPAETTTGDPFAAVEALLSRADVFARRAALADDPRTRDAWELDRAEVLALAGQPREAAEVVATVLERTPTDRRAIRMVRRLARRAGDDVTRANASYVLARLSRDPALRLALTRDALAVYDAEKTRDLKAAIATLQRIVEIAPASAEAERLLVLAREAGDPRSLVGVLTARLLHLANAPKVDEERVLGLLFERASALHAIDQPALAIADLDAVLERNRSNVAALQLRAELANNAGDSARAVELWTASLGFENTEVVRAEVRKRISETIDKVAPPVPPPVPRVRSRLATPARGFDALADESTTATWEGEITDADALVPPPPIGAKRERRQSNIVRRGLQPTDVFDAPTVVSSDPFGGDTPPADLTALQEQELRIARETPGAFDATTNTAVSPLATADRGATEGDAQPIRLPPIDVAWLQSVASAAGEPTLAPRQIRFPERSGLEDSSAFVSLDQLKPERVEATDEMLAEYEHELVLGEDPVVRVEAGKLCEMLGKHDRARAHYDAALLAEPRATAALVGLRRLARRAGDLGELTRLIDCELAVASPRERAPLLRHRLDLLIATGEQDLARVAVGELLDNAPTDIAALLVNLELALVDKRREEVGATLQRVAPVRDLQLRCAVQYARAVLAAQRGEADVAAAWFGAATRSDEGAIAARLTALCDAATAGDANAGAGLLELAHHVEKDDPVTAAALAIRARDLIPAGPNPEASTTAAQLAARAAPKDPLVARFSAETALAAGDATTASLAYARWARSGASPVERSYAAARAAELDPVRLARLWARVLEVTPDDDYAAARLRAAHLAANDANAAIELDLERARSTGRAAPLLRATTELVRQNRLPDAVAALVQARTQITPPTAVVDALVDVLAEAGAWGERVAVLDELATAPGALAPDVVRLRDAFARNALVRHGPAERSKEEVDRASVAAVEAWELVLADDARVPHGHAAMLRLAHRLGDVAVATDALVRIRAVEPSQACAASLALRQARLLVRSDPRHAEELARDGVGIADPRCALTALVAAAHRGDLRDALGVLEARATALEAMQAAQARQAGKPGQVGLEPSLLRLRAAHLARRLDEPAREVALLGRVDKPVWVGDLLDAARERTGQTLSAEGRPKVAGFARLVHEADRAVARGDGARAVPLYQAALGLRPDDPLATWPLLRVATQLRDPTLMPALALERLRLANVIGDSSARADAYELLARVDRELRGDAASARLALEAARDAEPERLDLTLELERELVADEQYADAIALREHRIRALRAAGQYHDLVALVLDTAALAAHARRSDDDLAELYRTALACDPNAGVALFQIETFLLTRGPSPELTALEDQLAEYFESPHAKAAALTRAGRTHAELGSAGEAVQRFARATDLAPTYTPALEAWRDTALRGQLWVALAEAEQRLARVARDPGGAAEAYHLAGVVLMDKARAAPPAITALLRALETNPRMLDALARLRILLDRHGHRDQLASILKARLADEREPAAQVELHRMLAELFRDAGERDAAVRHLRAMLAIDPTDARAHAALVDLATDQSNWIEAAEAVKARIALERDVTTLNKLHGRLGTICAGHDVAVALRSLQQALAYRPDDEDLLVKIADLAIGAGEWQSALEACDRLVTLQRDPAQLAAHLQRASTIFGRGFSDRTRAERMLLLALESDPTSTDGLRLLVQLYTESGDAAALVARTDQIASAMRAHIAEHPTDGAAYRMLAHALVGRHGGTVGAPRSARAAAELAKLLGAGDATIDDLLAEPTAIAPPLPDLDTLFAGAQEPAMRRVLQVLSEPLAKHAGIDLGHHGVGRKDRLRGQDPIVAQAREVAATMGIKDLEVYVSARDPHVMLAEPTSPPALVLGSAVVAADPAGVWFGAGAALLAVHAGLGIPGRMSRDELAVLGWSVLRALDPELPIGEGDEAVVDAYAQKLRRQIPAALADEARAHASTLRTFDHNALARDIQIARLRAGFVASGGLTAGLTLLAAAVGSDVPGVLAQPAVEALIAFAIV